MADVVPAPPDFGLIMWFDLSPMRPDAYMSQQAYRWHEVRTLQLAFRDGLKDATQEHETMAELMQMDHQA